MNDVYCTSDPALIERSQSLLGYLEQLVRARERPVLDIGTYTGSGGMVKWLADLSDEPEVRLSLGDQEERTGPWLRVERPHIPSPPVLPSQLHGWVDDAVKPDPNRPPTLRSRQMPGFKEKQGEVADGDTRPMEVEPTPEKLKDHPELAAPFERFRGQWEQWAEEKRRVTSVCDLYDGLFKAFQDTQEAAEEMELVLDLGLLT